MSSDVSIEEEPLEFDQLGLERAVRALCKAGIRKTPLTLERVKAWVNQFDTDAEKTLAWLILRNLVYRTTEQLESSLRQALKRATLHFLQTAGVAQSVHWKDALAGNFPELNFFCGPPTASETSLPGRSGEIVTRWLNRSYRVRKWYPHQITTLKPDEFYFVVDDGVYTGEQLRNFLASWGIDYANGKVTIVVGFAHENALQDLPAKFPGLTIFSGEVLTEKNGFQSLSARWIADGQWRHQESPYQVYRKLHLRKGPFELACPDGFGSLGLMVAFEHGIPDDSLQLLWDRSRNWTPLIER